MYKVHAFIQPAKDGRFAVLRVKYKRAKKTDDMDWEVNK